MKFTRGGWYLHRLRAMSPREVFLHTRKKLRQIADREAGVHSTFRVGSPSPSFPPLSSPIEAPQAICNALEADAESILSGRWKAFGHLPLQVDDPPRWHQDYLAGVDLSTTRSAFTLNHRELPGGADIKLIWELSRWNQLVRLAQTAFVVGDARAATTCLRWLKDWVAVNPAYRGWNWTSALEVAIRLIQFTWIDALLSGMTETRRTSAADETRDLVTLRGAILPAHIRFAWRYQSFGSSANNHLLGELAGLIVATARWPELERCGASMVRLRRLFEREVLAQFAEDGGNREQALHYHLFSFEFCWQARMALRAAGLPFSEGVETRLDRARKFFTEVHIAGEPWDYGDSDGAFVTPFFLKEEAAADEWSHWLRAPSESAGLRYWLGDRLDGAKGGTPATLADNRDLERAGWKVRTATGLATCFYDTWKLRFDFSPLGYLSTAAHGHLDALHLSIWLREVAMVIDPGTGAYYADEPLRLHLASWEAHNGPHLQGSDSPRRLGPFLWARHHDHPRLREDEAGVLTAELTLPEGHVKRAIGRAETGNGWRVEDAFAAKGSAEHDAFMVRWQFAPGCRVESLGEREFQIVQSGAALQVVVSPEWQAVRLVAEPESGAKRLAGIVSPRFRSVCFAPYLELQGHAGQSGCATSFQAG